MSGTFNRRTEASAAVEKLKAAGYTVIERSTFLDCTKGDIRMPLDIIAGTVNAQKLSYLVFIA